MVEWRITKCYAEFRKHCIKRHALRESDTDAQMFFDLKEGTLTLILSCLHEAKRATRGRV
jgi:hypothetical protein